PFIWGFASRWLPPLLGLKKTRKTMLIPVMAILFAGVATSFFSLIAGAVILTIAALMFGIALRTFERSEREPKLRGVHESTPLFIRIAFLWSVVAGAPARTRRRMATRARRATRSR